MGAARVGTRVCAAAPGPPGSRRRAAPGADSARALPSRVFWGRGWRGRFLVDSRLLSCVRDFLLLLSAVTIVGCTLFAVRFWFVLCMPFNCLRCGSSSVEEGGFRKIKRGL